MPRRVIVVHFLKCFFFAKSWQRHRIFPGHSGRHIFDLSTLSFHGRRKVLGLKLAPEGGFYVKFMYSLTSDGIWVNFGEIFRNVTFRRDRLGWSLRIGNGRVMQRLLSDFLESEVMHDWPVTWWFSGDLMPPLQRELQFFREYKKHVGWTCWTWEVTWWFGAPNLQLTWRPCDLVTWWPLCSENFNFFVKMKGMWAEPAAVQLTRWLGDLV